MSETEERWCWVIIRLSKIVIIAFFSFQNPNEETLKRHTREETQTPHPEETLKRHTSEETETLHPWKNT